MSPTKREPKAKLAHLEACLQEGSQYTQTTGLETFSLENQAAVDVNLHDIDLTVDFLGKKLGAPLMIAPMTGGVQRGAELNERWAKAAERFNLPMGVGSQRIGIENSAFANFYDLRKHAPSAFIFANIGVGQLCRGWGVEEALKAVEMVKANALFIHLNAMQEACQGGDLNFELLTFKLTEICSVLKKLQVPVFVREVCFGFSKEATRRLLDIGVSGLDCAGAGGTSWAKVEGICAANEKERTIASCFGEWGIPTAQSILNVRAVSKEIPLIATGGIRTGLDVAKSVALGADLAAMARPMLITACQSEEVLNNFIEQTLCELRIAMFASGARDIQELKSSNVSFHASNSIPRF